MHEAANAKCFMISIECRIITSAPRCSCHISRFILLMIYLLSELIELTFDIFFHFYEHINSIHTTMELSTAYSLEKFRKMYE